MAYSDEGSKSFQAFSPPPRRRRSPPPPVASPPSVRWLTLRPV